MTINKFLDELNIFVSGYYEGDDYIVDLSSDDEFGRIFSLLDSADNLQNYDTDLSEEETHLVYYSDEFEVHLTGNFDTNEYQLIVKPLSEDNEEETEEETKEDNEKEEKED